MPSTRRQFLGGASVAILSQLAGCQAVFEGQPTETQQGRELVQSQHRSTETSQGRRLLTLSPADDVSPANVKQGLRLGAVTLSRAVDARECPDWNLVIRATNTSSEVVHLDTVSLALLNDSGERVTTQTVQAKSDGGDMAPEVEPGSIVVGTKALASSECYRDSRFNGYRLLGVQFRDG